MKESLLWTDLVAIQIFFFFFFECCLNLTFCVSLGLSSQIRNNDWIIFSRHVTAILAAVDITVGD